MKALILLMFLTVPAMAQLGDHRYIMPMVDTVVNENAWITPERLLCLWDSYKTECITDSLSHDKAKSGWRVPFWDKNCGPDSLWDARCSETDPPNDEFYKIYRWYWTHPRKPTFAGFMEYLRRLTK